MVVDTGRWLIEHVRTGCNASAVEKWASGSALFQEPPQRRHRAMRRPTPTRLPLPARGRVLRLCAHGALNRAATLLAESQLRSNPRSPARRVTDSFQDRRGARIAPRTRQPSRMAFLSRLLEDRQYRESRFAGVLSEVRPQSGARGHDARTVRALCRLAARYRIQFHYWRARHSQPLARMPG